MTDQTQSAVEAMARAIDLISEARGENPNAYARLDNPHQCARAARTAFLAHLAASGWQIVPKVATDEWACSLIKTNAEDFEENRGAYLLEIQNLKAEYDALIAAAPQFPGRGG